jgi:hypothetical protein
MGEAEFEDNIRSARGMMDDEATRTRAGFQGGGLGGQTGQQVPAGGPQQPLPHQSAFSQPQQQPFNFSGGGGPVPQPGPPTSGSAGPFQQQFAGASSGAAFGNPFRGPAPTVGPSTGGFFRPQQVGPSRALGGFGQMGPDPAYGSTGFQPQQQIGSSEAATAAFMRQLAPALSWMPDNLILAQPIDVIYRLNREEKMAEAQSEAAKASKGLDARLHQNFQKAEANPVYLEGSWDNRSSVLHPARFLPGAAVPVTQLWLEARKLWGPDGVEAIGNYDLETVSCTGCVTARGWELLHKPGCGDISIKLYTVANVGHSATGTRTMTLSGEDGITISESWKELTELADFKLAMRNLRMAARLAAPWNFSFDVIDGFLQSKDYMESDLAGLKKAPTISSFTDYCLKTNASLWVRQSPFMDSARLEAVWTSWWSSRKAGVKAEHHGAGQSAGNGKQKGGGKSDGGQKGGYGQQAAKSKGQQVPANLTKHTGPPTEKTICRKYNDKSCPNNFKTCVTAIDGKPSIRLYHVCNFMKKKPDGSSDGLCLQYHPRVDHK